MGELFGSSKKQSASQDQTGSFNQSGTTSQDSNYTRNVLFDPNAAGTVGALANRFGNIGAPGGGGDAAKGFLMSMLQPGGMNPYAQQVVDANNKLADADFQKRLGMVRGAGYGGGIGRDLINQGMFASDYTNQQNYMNAKTLLDAWNADRGFQLQGANSLLGQDQGDLGSALAFINALRGETGQAKQTGTENTSGTSKSNTVSKGKESGFGLGVKLG